MKKITLLFAIVFLSACIISCSNNEDETLTNEKFVATVDGKRIVFDKSFYVYNNQEKYVSIAATKTNSDGTKNAIEIILYSNSNQYFKKGTYNLSDGVGANADDVMAGYVVIDKNNNPSEAYTTSPDIGISATSLGTLEITEYSNGKVSGNFNFKGYNQDGSKTIVVTNGSFNELTEM